MLLFCTVYVNIVHGICLHFVHYMLIVCTVYVNIVYSICELFWNIYNFDSVEAVASGLLSATTHLCFLL